MEAKIPGFNPLQKTVYTILSEHFTGIPVVDYVEENTSFPYISIGEDVFSDDSSKTDFTDVAMVVVRVWSRAKGFSEAKSILSEIIEVLSTVDTEAEGYLIKYYGITQMETSRESDGITRSGMVRIKFRVNQGD